MNGDSRYRPSAVTLLGFLCCKDVIDHDNDYYYYYDCDVKYSAPAYKEILNIYLKKEFKLGRRIHCE